MNDYWLTRWEVSCLRRKRRLQKRRLQKTKEDYKKKITKKKEVPEKDRIIAELQTEVTILKRRVREWERKEDERRYKV